MKNNTFENRLRSVRNILSLKHLDGIFFNSLENIRYLTGFTGSDGALIVTPEDSFFLTDSRYWTQADEEVLGSQIIHYKKKLDAILLLCSENKIGFIGFESHSLGFLSHQTLSEKLPVGSSLIPLDAELKYLRAVKDDHELILIRKAIDIASSAFLHISKMIREGIVEKDLALEMEYFMKRNGAESSGFDIIVASGTRSALPHGKAGMKRIEKGDLILIDFGSQFEGYHSDQTRTLICGHPSQEQSKIFQTVKEAHDKAIEKIRPGIPICEVDAEARLHIQGQGFGEYFGHGTGHGIGLAVHEDPAVNPENKELLKEGMIFTVEPGIYLPGLGGVRIENMIRVTAQGSDVLTSLPVAFVEV